MTLGTAQPRGKKNAELKSPAKIKSEKLSTLEMPVAKPDTFTQWIAQVSQLWGFDIARLRFIFLSKLLKV